ncbi:MAG: hypothetical protein FWE40_03255 [Oscillospiraceae bacterium]|nr:hypothetical protein [Oscillospiraceae bacterium]
MKLLALLLVFALLLAACGIGTTPTNSTETTTEHTTTAAEEALPEPWREIVQFELSLGHVLTEQFFPELNVFGIALRENDQYTLLLNPTEAYPIFTYALEAAINDRFFAFISAKPNTCAISGVIFYDIMEQRIISVRAQVQPTVYTSSLDLHHVEDRYIYVRERFWGDIPEYITLFRFAVAQLEQGGTVIALPAGEIAAQDLLQNSAEMS